MAKRPAGRQPDETESARRYRFLLAALTALVEDHDRRQPTAQSMGVAELRNKLVDLLYQCRTIR